MFFTDHFMHILVILFFLLGLVAYALTTDLYVPKPLDQTLSIQKANLDVHKQLIAINLYADKSSSSKIMLSEAPQFSLGNSILIYNNDMRQQN